VYYLQFLPSAADCLFTLLPSLLYNNIFLKKAIILLYVKIIYNILTYLSIKTQVLLFLLFLPVLRGRAAMELLEDAAEIGSGIIAAKLRNFANGFGRKLQHLAGVFDSDLI